MTVAIIDYNAGNIYSVVHALKRLGVTPVVTDDAAAIRMADKVLFPGQGEARQAMTHLHQRGLDTLIPTLTQPVLGICIGQQLLCRHSEEGDTAGLGIFDAEVRRMRPLRHEDKVPHMGWNTIEVPAAPLQAAVATAAHPAIFDSSILTEGLETYVYFVHSYAVPLCRHTVAQTTYIEPFSSAMQRDNFYATQFHPEKSGPVGQQLLANFLAL